MMKNLFSTKLLLMPLFLLLFSAGSLAAATLTVTSTIDGDPGSFRDVLANSVSGDIIVFDATTNFVPQVISISQIFIVNKTLTIIGNGIDVTIIEGGFFDGIMTNTDSNVDYFDMTFQNGTNSQGGASLVFGGNISYTRVKFLNNNADNQDPSLFTGGGALSSGFDAVVDIVDCIFEGNTSTGFGAIGGAIMNDARMNISGTTFAGNSASENGGAIATINAGRVTNVSNSTFTENEAQGAIDDGDGGAIYGSGFSTTNIAGSVFTINIAARNGGAVFSQFGTTKVDGSTFDFNTAGNGGGGLAAEAGKLIIRNSDIINNQAVEGGGLWNGTGLMQVNDTDVFDNVATGNDADQGGGGIFNAGGSLRMSGATIRSNDALGTSGSGGGIFNDVGGSVKMLNGQITDNNASRAGGGLEDNSGAGSRVNLRFVFIASNTVATNPGNGGGIHITGAGDMFIGNCTVFENSAGAEGGGVWNGTGTMTIRETTFEDNTAAGDGADQGGGAIFNAGGTVIATDCDILNCSATGTAGSGGGILNDADGVVRTLRTNITGCRANRAGGGIESNGGEVYFFRGFIESCDAGTNPGSGGGIHSTGFCRIIDAEVHFNTAINGGGLWNGGDGFLDVYTSTVDFNELAAIPGSAGGGIFQQSGTLIMTMSTVANNSADLAAGIAITSGIADIQSCTVARNTVNETNTAGGVAMFPNVEVIIANNVIALNTTIGGTPYDVSGQGFFTSQGYNFIGADDDSGLIAAAATSNDQFGTQAAPIDPNLDVLADNGGFTTTMAILCPSPLIDAGKPGYQDDDQRDQPVFGGRKDIGAYELQQDCGGEPFAGDIEQLEVADETFRTSVYPNPVTNGRATVQIPTAFGETVTLRVMDMSGMVILERQAFAGTEEMDLARLPKGTYTLQVISATTTESHRVIISQ